MEDSTRNEHHLPGTAASEESSTPPNEKAHEGVEGKTEHLEAIRTVSRVPNPRYYEKDGLRTYGDDEDHDHEPPVSSRRCCIWSFQD
jgi:hypothetical protein